MKVHELAAIEHLHHAYLVTGNAAKGAEEVLAMLAKRGVKTIGNPDVLTYSYAEFSVDAAREVSSYALLKSLGEAKYLIISFSKATNESQNALLKIIEEAPGSTIFFFCIDALGHVLATIRSRTIAVSVSDANLKTGDEDTAKEVREFLQGEYPERLAMVDKMTSYITKTQDRSPVRAFVKELLSRVHEQGASPQALRDLLDAEGYMRMQGSSVKAILGHLAVTLPRSRS